MDGVESVSVSLNEGLARISLKPGNRLGLGRFREVVERNGFTPQEARIAGIGEIVPREARLELRVTEAEEVYELVMDPPSQESEKELRRHAGKTIFVEGVIPPVGGDARPVLQLTGFRPQKD
jgi:hypothetical protein